MSWTDENTAVLIKLHDDGLSAGKIFPKLNSQFGTSFSRNAVIGKIHRMGLRRPAPARPSTARKAKPRRVVPRLRSLRPGSPPTPKRVPFKPRPKTAEVNAKAVNDGKGMTILEIEDGQCRFPVNDMDEGQSGEFRFCGRPQDPDAPKHAGQYCADHLAITTTAPRTYGERTAHHLTNRMYHGTKRLTQ